VTLIDSGDAAAAEVERLLLSSNLGNTRPEKPNLQFLVSDIPARFSEVGERFLGHRLGRVQRVSL
jgi:glutamate racemase